MGLQPELKLAIDNFIASNKVVLFMKGNKQFPQCGFSNTCVQVSAVRSGQSAAGLRSGVAEESHIATADFEHPQRAL